ncbi:MAG: GH92 family glycosyl hydrolase [Kiritimatiellales bacterium]|nr:GH92 family glycosyl hydrolase [Kiritimatiellales bacterium]
MKSVWLLIAAISAGSLYAKEPAEYINPMIGAFAPSGSRLKGKECGRTFPGVATPFGLVQLSPDTITGGDNGNGYSWFDTTIEGFSFTHMSGIGALGDFGNFQVMATTGPLMTSRGDPKAPDEGYRSRFSHDTEVAQAGYYAVTLDDYNVRTELTAAQRAGMVRFTFPKHKQSRIQIDLSRRVAGTSTEQYVNVVDDRTIEGWMKCTSEGGGWMRGNGKIDYTVYFYCQFSKPMTSFGVWSAKIPDGQERQMNDVLSKSYQALVAHAEVLPDKREMQGKHLGFYTEFPTKDNEAVLLKSGISFVSMKGARENLEHDIPGWNFDGMKGKSRDRWNKSMNMMHIKGGSEDDKVIFYTALYRTMIDPRNFSDVSGEYYGADKKIHKADDFIYRTIFSGWDVFRSQFPLLTLINPEIVNDEVNSLMQMAQLSGRGYFPRWELANSYTGCMLGNPAVSVVVDAYEKGIRNYDAEKAFDICKASVDKFGNVKNGGYTRGSLSRTLEYAYSDWCVGRFAESLGKKALATEYYERGQAYKNVWDPEVKWFRARNGKDKWKPWEEKTKHGQGCTESNPYQQGWFVPHDIPGLLELGGKVFLTQELKTFFNKSPADFKWNDYYNHSNEPVHHIPFMFNEFGLPHLTQYWTRRICAAAYSNEVMGIVGNEDVGQMSAWYILAAAGLHPICPGDNKWQITSPVFDEISIRLDPKYYPGKTFTIKAHNNSKENVIISKMALNGKPLERYWLDHHEIVKGGMLEMWLVSPAKAGVSVK